ncbi:DUF2142 domain-containing protein [Acetobacter orientalis]|uniref:DUF2142 domain-containing protein n=1 Tax=Acetobacter orientalis TaxID=146474 RepID=A0A2Z5ZMI3_9PROT|nr:DUF2142 domain-containing protein [Acetobacter orientalis]
MKINCSEADAPSGALVVIVGLMPQKNHTENTITLLKQDVKA